MAFLDQFDRSQATVLVALLLEPLSERELYNEISEDRIAHLATEGANWSEYLGQMVSSELITRTKYGLKLTRKGRARLAEILLQVL